MPRGSRLAFDAEASILRGFYHTFRSTANYHESGRLRDKLLAFARQSELSPGTLAETKTRYAWWREVLLDEKENSLAAIP